MWQSLYVRFTELSIKVLRLLCLLQIHYIYIIKCISKAIFIHNIKCSSYTNMILTLDDESPSLQIS